MDKVYHHPNGDDRFYGEADEVVKWGIKPIIGILLAILALPIFLAHGLYRGFVGCFGAAAALGDDFYYWSKVHYWGKYMPSYRRRMKKAKEAKNG